MALQNWAACLKFPAHAARGLLDRAVVEERPRQSLDYQAPGEVYRGRGSRGLNTEKS